MIDLDTVNAAPPGYARDSLRAIDAEPGRCIASSTRLGWTSGLLRLYHAQAACDPFDTVATPDQTVVVHLSGRSELKCLSDGIWRTRITVPGLVGLTPGGETSRLRWRCLDDVGGLSAHLHLPQALMREAAEDCRMPGQHAPAASLNALSVADVAVSEIARTLVQGLRAGESSLFAEALFVQLARCLVDPVRRRPSDVDERGRAGTLDDRRLRRALDLMTSDLSAPMTLGAVARESGISKFHFVRLFRQRMGCPPHAFVAALRLDTARRMLTTCDLPVATIAALVGYPIARNFATAFRRRFGCSPASLRHAGHEDDAPSLRERAGAPDACASSDADLAGRAARIGTH